MHRTPDDMPLTGGSAPAHPDRNGIGTTVSRGRLRGDAGEGVISAAIAVLIMAFLGAAMWIGFQRMWRTTETTTNQKVEQIGNDAP
jgi:hypothetical protein